ncbi:unnamed protein product [Chondrus crispus]|uniref:Probable ATP-dependent transporter ycf16 n=1 Tax=Chondrus crispus TaxID=2769 RepID=R7Q5S3_CHOCR|nr:unnamed protein product [Chondrus crispus]CDF33364.1 unnamed protein product [Chondrus crispus]|eukprot:XP_005713167.1 unnamed protein product [Chondrus crispus]
MQNVNCHDGGGWECDWLRQNRHACIERPLRGIAIKTTPGCTYSAVVDDQCKTWCPGDWPLSRAGLAHACPLVPNRKLSFLTALRTPFTMEPGDSDLKPSSAPPKWKFWARKEKVPEEERKYPPVPYIRLFRYASNADKLMLGLALLAAIGHGTLLPILTVIFGDVVDQFGPFLTAGAIESDIDISDSIASKVNLFLYLAIVAFALSFLQLSLSVIAANRIGNDLRKKFFDNLTRQDCNFYDDSEAGSLTHIVISDVNLIQGGIGDKLCTAVQYFTTFVTGVIVGFAYGWKLTLLILGVTPILLVAGAVFGNASADATGDGLGAYGEAGGVAQEVFSLIRTVTAFGGQEDELRRYEKSLDKAYIASVKAAIASGFGLGTAMFCILSTYGLAFFVGANLARVSDPEIEPEMSPGDIDPQNDDGLIPTEPTTGHVTFENLDFNYPKRITEEGVSALVLDNFNLDIAAGTSEAFVGKSGCGKSTLARMIQRFYDPIAGSVRLDGVDIRELNVRWLRSQIGVVAQMPSLFMLSIRDNIALVTNDDIIEAAKLANAHNFIIKLPEGYDTMLGERGAMLSGGQKQRVCIARALIRNPKLLILDESTAALDTASERLVQDALDKAAAGRTTVTIAHRLSTIRNADNISCVDGGKVVERGPHDELVRREGGFYRAVHDLQNVQRDKMQKEKEAETEDDSDSKLAPVLAAQKSMSKTAHSTSVRDALAVEEEKALAAVDKGVFWRTVKMNKGEFSYMFIGILGAVAVGVVWPIAAISLTELVEIMLTENDPSDVRVWALSFKLTRRIRSDAFRALLRQEMGYFDMEENSVGALAGRLSSDAGAIKGLTGDLFGVGVNVLGALVAGLTIAFVNCWELTLVVLAIIPGIALGGYFEMQASAGIDSGARKDFAQANVVAAEAVDNIATVRTLGLEDYFASRYSKMIHKTRRDKLRKAVVTAIAFGFSEFCQYLLWYATFKAGGNFVRDGRCSFKEMLLSSMAILFAAITFGNVSVFAPDVGASQIGATHIYRLLDRESEIDPTSKDGEDVDHVAGDVSSKKVYFEYPRRPDVPVLRGLSIDVSRGKTLALVGTSGHGKSTIISLLERFYSYREGTIHIDEHEISKARVATLRNHIGLVSQEPELFNRSVFENIAYGAPHEDGTPITMTDVIEAAKKANAHEFVSALPQGYDTVVGPRGDALSGGQRQRVAIARSLIRAPPVLLLDEATSALDSASERLVQAALDKASDGRTTIVVAHRLSTIKDADVIAVVRKGRIVESGTHGELLRKNGHYADLVQHQLSDV